MNTRHILHVGNIEVIGVLPDGNACIGWLLDQRKNGVGSIALRMRLITKPEAARQFEECHSGGAKMFVSVAAMCRANGVRGRR